MSEYVVLLQDVPEGRWTVVKTVTASSADAAIRQTVDSKSKGGTFCAVPARSWQPKTVTVETKTQVKLT